MFDLIVAVVHAGVVDSLELRGAENWRQSETHLPAFGDVIHEILDTLAHPRRGILLSTVQVLMKVESGDERCSEKARRHHRLYLTDHSFEHGMVTERNNSHDSSAVYE